MNSKIWKKRNMKIILSILIMNVNSHNKANSKFFQNTPRVIPSGVRGERTSSTPEGFGRHSGTSSPTCEAAFASACQCFFFLVFRFLPKTMRSSFLVPFCIASTNRWHIQIEMFSLPVGDSQLWLWLSWPWQQQTAKLFPTGRDETPKTKAKAHFIHGWKDDMQQWKTGRMWTLSNKKYQMSSPDSIHKWFQ